MSFVLSGSVPSRHHYFLPQDSSPSGAPQPPPDYQPGGPRSPHTEGRSERLVLPHTHCSLDPVTIFDRKTIYYLGSVVNEPQRPLPLTPHQVCQSHLDVCFCEQAKFFRGFCAFGIAVPCTCRRGVSNGIRYACGKPPGSYTPSFLSPPFRQNLTHLPQIPPMAWQWPWQEPTLRY